MTRRLLLAAALGAITILPGSADASSRSWCLCQGKESGRLHHRFACEYHFKKAGYWPASGPASKSGGCSREEWAQFKTFLCVGGGCTYEYIRSSASKVPLGK